MTFGANSPSIQKKKDGDVTFVKEFCAFANYRGDKLYAISEEVIRFLVALIDTHYGVDHVYDSCSAVVYNCCGDPDPRSLQKFIDKHIWQD